MRIVADRFAAANETHAIDLATGERTTVVAAPAADAADMRRWLCRCDELHRLRHPSIAVLADYGTIGTLHRFEAWHCGGVWRGSGIVAARALRAALDFLHAIDLVDDPSAGGQGAMHHSPRGPVLIPAASVGFRVDAGERQPHEWRSGWLPGLVVADRAAVRELADVFGESGEERPRIVALWGPPGAGKRTAILSLARTARLNGFIPIDADLAPRFWPHLVDRTFFVINRSESSARWSAWLQAALRSPRPHVGLLVGDEEPRGIDGLPLERFSDDALVALVRPAAAQALPDVRRAARRAQGLPGRLVHAVWPTQASVVARERQPATFLGAAERQPFYGDDIEPLSESAGGETVHAWPAPGELAALRRKMASAAALLQAGRHAPGLRLLRQALGGLVRRKAWTDALPASLQLASTLLRRGRTQEAARALAAARDHSIEADDAAALLEVAILTGEMEIDAIHLDSAEHTLRAAMASARTAGDRRRGARATMGLARCFFWRARHADGAALLRELGPEPDPSEEIRRLRLAAKHEVALGDPASAMAMLAEARGRAASLNQSVRLAEVEHTAMLVHLMLGDLDAVARGSASLVSACRASRQPVREFSARLFQMEGERRGGRPAPRGRLDPLRRMAVTMPPIVRARWDLFSALISGKESEAGAIERAVAGSGLAAIGLFARPAIDSAPGGASDPFVDEIVSILHVCQAASDEAAVLNDVCARVRRQLEAASVAFVASGATRLDVVAGDGPRIDLAAAEAAIAAGIVIAPRLRDGRYEAGAAVQYGGRIVGALAARWTLGSTLVLSRASAVLSTAAAAAAPLVAALLAERERRSVPGGLELIGVTAAMTELRRAVERAAAAPFSVLVEGESGAGKELVARAIHRASPRRDRAFCTLNCAALPDDLIEAELFGHARGSFTGAIAERAGIFEEAHTGTLMLDEVGELSPRAQAKLLRVIQEGELRRVGENIARRVDVRIVAATNRDLRREVEGGRFRVDLLYRLDIIRIGVPPLRERREDIALLVDHFWKDATGRVGSRATLGVAARAALAAYDWPGNVRELQNVLASLAVRSPKRGVVPPTALPAQFGVHPGGGAWRLDAARRTFEEGFVRAALVRAGGHRGRAATELGVTRQGLTKLMARLGIRDEQQTAL